ncbi:hypothetical protein V8D89_012102 [Ganoderma adspersum]
MENVVSEGRRVSQAGVAMSEAELAYILIQTTEPQPLVAAWCLDLSAVDSPGSLLLATKHSSQVHPHLPFFTMPQTSLKTWSASSGAKVPHPSKRLSETTIDHTLAFTSDMGRCCVHARCSKVDALGVRCKTLVPLVNTLCFPRSRGFPLYCNRHENKVLAEKVPGTPPFRVFIPGCLERPTQVLLHHLMRKSVAKSDRPGFIYALTWIGESFRGLFPIRFATTRSLLDHNDPNLIRIKVGWSNDVARRLSEHRRRCPSVWPILLGCSCLSPHCDRLERLIHVELADRAAQSYPAGRTALLAKCKDFILAAGHPISVARPPTIPCPSPFPPSRDVIRAGLSSIRTERDGQSKSSHRCPGTAVCRGVSIGEGGSASRARAVEDSGEKVAAAAEEEEEEEEEEGWGQGGEGEERGAAVTQTVSAHLTRRREKRLPKWDTKCSTHIKSHLWTFRQPTRAHKGCQASSGQSITGFINERSNLAVPNVTQGLCSWHQRQAIMKRVIDGRRGWGARNDSGVTDRCDLELSLDGGMVTDVDRPGLGRPLAEGTHDIFRQAERSEVCGATRSRRVATVVRTRKNVEEVAFEPGAGGAGTVGAKEERRACAMAVVAAGYIVTEDHNGIDATRGSGS